MSKPQLRRNPRRKTMTIQRCYEPEILHKHSSTTAVPIPFLKRPDPRYVSILKRLCLEQGVFGRRPLYRGNGLARHEDGRFTMKPDGNDRQQTSAALSPRCCVRARQSPAHCRTRGAALVTIMHTSMRLPGSHCSKCCPRRLPERVSSTGPGTEGAPGEPDQLDLDSATKTTRLMSWSEGKPAAPEWRGAVVPAKAEAELPEWRCPAQSVDALDCSPPKRVHGCDVPVTEDSFR
jgi:hypothetical protein